MNVEKTIEFILAEQAKNEARWAKNEARWAISDARADARYAKIDKRLDAIGKLIQHGMRMIVKGEEARREQDEKIKILIDGQIRTDQKLQAFIDSLNKGRNGHKL